MIKLILVEPKYQFNLGYTARVAKNFGINELNLVNPKVKVNGKMAKMLAKHAVDLIENAKIYDSIKDAVKGCDIVIGTTGIWRKAIKNKKCACTLDEAVKKIKEGNFKNIALLIGRDDIGLSKEEIEDCDMVIFIPTSKDYPVLNLSHSVAILLYELTKNNLGKIYKVKNEYAKRDEIEYLFKLFWKNIEKRKDIRNKRLVLEAFKKAVIYSNLNKNEIHALITALS